MAKSTENSTNWRIPAAVTAAGMTLIALATSCASTSYFAGPKSQALATRFHGLEASCAPAMETEPESEVLRVMTVNLAHGRKDGPNQLFQKTSDIEANLDDIAHVIRRVDPHIVALQEADGPSGWSGQFDHIVRLASAAALPYSVRGDHMRGLSLTYGTALCSRVPLLDAESHAFDAAPPMFTKGFVVTTVPWPDGSGREVDFVSIHLDFARAGVRRRQVRELVDVLSRRSGPFVVMGDFNCDGRKKDDAVSWLMRETGLLAFEPDSTGLKTFRTLDKRLDWILVSPELEFVSYTVLPDILSDHKAVTSEIAWRTSPGHAG